MRRRHLLTGGAALTVASISLARPALASPAKTILHVPQANLTSLDPVWTTAVVTRNSAHLLFETLYGRDEQLNPQPQMVEGHLTEDNARRWTMRLREGLRFHDGERVLARDCVASLRRRVGGDVAIPTPHRPGRAGFPHPVPHGRASLMVV